MKKLIVIALMATAAWAGPPLICHPVDIGQARSLPWNVGDNWNGADPAYNLRSLIPDTLAILVPSAPVPLRMETLRRAAIYAARDEGASHELTSRLLARIADETAGKDIAPYAWFDAGYFVETLRQATFIYRYDMLTAAEKQRWRLRQAGSALDGKPWIEHAIQLGGKGMQLALSRVEEYRTADRRQAAKTN